jgi:hypothetical protein
MSLLDSAIQCVHTGLSRMYTSSYTSKYSSSYAGGRGASRPLGIAVIVQRYLCYLCSFIQTTILRFANPTTPSSVRVLVQRLLCALIQGFAIPSSCPRATALARSCPPRSRAVSRLEYPSGAPKFQGTVFLKMTPSTGRGSDVRDSVDSCRLSGASDEVLLELLSLACCRAILMSSLSRALSKIVSWLPSPGLGARVRGPVRPMSCCGVVD